MKTIIIIGGSKGIGKAIVESLIDHFKIINISRSPSQINHQNFSQFQCDVLEDELPEIEVADSLIYCPGSINLKPISRLSLEDFKTDFNINVLGAVKAIQHYLPILKKGNNPSIVLFSTVAVKMGMPFHSSIAVAKGGVEGLVKSLAAELAPTVRVNAIAPTVTDTGLADKLLRNDKMKEKMIERHPLKKYLDPKEVATMAEFLISEKTASISGQIFEMDCGIVTLKI
ncbi:SDR family oxidoreductase [Aureibaculum sp. A20]|uniref:SDR family oxidoreductase n=1 Tax=Aureibaculum flavum TaxID=2795986 RepID=A0ABS0WRN6_9FLAO|nr:SDR family oxidoreductase [Aureibaculum flavum]MBJ2174628.1 SDR family oxidoreductase [Aureibaculum flavum]